MCKPSPFSSAPCCPLSSLSHRRYLSLYSPVSPPLPSPSCSPAASAALLSATPPAPVGSRSGAGTWLGVGTTLPNFCRCLDALDSSMLALGSLVLCSTGMGSSRDPSGSMEVEAAQELMAATMVPAAQYHQGAWSEPIAEELVGLDGGVGSLDESGEAQSAMEACAKAHGAGPEPIQDN